jgi:hypothetical protein
MGMVAPEQRIASAFVVYFGPFGAVSQHARQRGICRQRVYREAAWLASRIDDATYQSEIDRLRQENYLLQERLKEAEQRLERAVVLDEDKQAEFATVGQAIGVSLPEVRVLLDVLLPGKIPSVATLGRWTQAMGRKAGPLLAVFDEFTHPQVRQAVVDEIYVSQPVLMVVEPASLCWVAGRRLDESLTGAVWVEEMGRLPALEQVARDNGSCLGRGVADLNKRRQEHGLAAVADQLDHFHMLRDGGRAVGRTERAARRAFKAVEKAEALLAKCEREGRVSSAGCKSRLRACLAKAERAMDIWMARERVWQEVKAAVQPFTPEGHLNTRAGAEKRLAELLPQLPDAEFATVKRQLQRPEMLTYLDEIQRKLAALDVPADIKQAVVRQEGLRRRPELLQADTVQAAALRGVMLACAAALARSGEVGQHAVEAVRSILRTSWRASSLVECVNSVLRMQQARHRKLSQGLLDLKRLYWNCHQFRTGHRRGQSPYQRLGVSWPEGLRWWDVLKWSTEQLRDKLSALNQAA